MKLFAVICFFVGVVSLAGLVIRRGRNIKPDHVDAILTFLGIAGAITGMILLFNRLG